MTAKRFIFLSIPICLLLSYSLLGVTFIEGLGKDTHYFFAGASYALIYFFIFFMTYAIIYYKRGHNQSGIIEYIVFAILYGIVIISFPITVWVGVVHFVAVLYSIFLMIYWYSFFYSYLKNNQLI